MKTKMTLKFSLVLAALLLASCSEKQTPRFDETQEGFFIAGNIEGVNPQTLSAADQDLYHHVGLSMLVEQFEAVNLPTMRAAIAANPPAGVVFWNPNRVGASELSVITRAYAASARSAAKPQPPMLFSTDYEGGGLTKTIRGTTVPGIQRFRTGFTLLPHGQWLGKEIQDKNTDEICALQGEIMGRELTAAGINYPLATVSDLAGGLFINRGISADPAVVSRCMTTLLENFNRASGGKSVFVTKHFPGLGFTRGDTHEMTVTSSRRGAEFERHISPYRAILSQLRQTGQENLLSVMVGHAQFTAYAPRNTSTESSYVLSNILKGRAQFQEQDGGQVQPLQGLGFSGLVLSDAMWMGVYGFVHQMATSGRLAEGADKIAELKQLLVQERLFTAEQVQSLVAADYQRVYNVMNLNSILSGMDLLMVPNVQFARLVLFLRKGITNQWTPEELRLIRVRTGLNGEQAQARLKQRLTNIIQKNRDIRSQLSHPTAMSEIPQNTSTRQNERMTRVLRSLGF